MNKLDEKIRLESRIREVANIRFSASRRVHFNYVIAKLTVVILSLWAIFITVVVSLSNDYESMDDVPFTLSIASVLIPVFVVIFSLIEGGEQYLKGHNLNIVARKLREFSDDILADTEFQDIKNINWERKFKEYYKEYNDILERHNVDHDDVDYLRQKFIEKRDKYSPQSKEKRMFGQYRPNMKGGGQSDFGLWVYFLLLTWLIWLRRQAQRFLYISSWFLPFLLLPDFA